MHRRNEGATFRGLRCPQGHDGTRYVSSRACVECTKASARASYARKRGRAAIPTATVEGRLFRG